MLLFILSLSSCPCPSVLFVGLLYSSFLNSNFPSMIEVHETIIHEIQTIGHTPGKVEIFKKLEGLLPAL